MLIDSASPKTCTISRQKLPLITWIRTVMYKERLIMVDVPEENLCLG